MNITPTIVPNINSDSEFSNYTLIKSEINDFIPIKDFEKDPIIRKTTYPYITHIKIEKYTYKRPDGIIITRTITNKKRDGKQFAIDQRSKMKKFGKALESNDGVKSIGAEVFILSPKAMKKANEGFKTTSKGSSKISFSSAMKSFKPSFKNLEKFKNLKEFTNTDTFSSKISTTGFTKTFIPSKMKSKIAENMHLEKFSIVIKNIPAEEDLKEIESKLRKLFKPFGEIERLKVLSDKYDNTLSRDIAFLDLIYPSDANKLLYSNERFTIGHNILNLEKSKSTK